MKRNTPIRIGIIYLAIGIYDEFWKEFYPSCEKYFCPDAVKGYEVFTDSERLLALELDNVTCHPMENRGFIRNVSAKSECICSIAERLEHEYDYIFFLNGNFKYLESIHTDEVIPLEENDFLTALSFSFYRNRDCKELPYDRNLDCLAYIPYGEGTRYYQGGLYGGRTQEIIRMSGWIRNRIDHDLARKVIARWHDESYVNRYLLDKNPKLLDETYAFVEGMMPFRPHKMMILDKKKYLGKKLEQFKDLSIDNSLSFLLDDNLEPRKMGIVHGQGRLGNQMFQFAYLLYLRKRCGVEMDWYLSDRGFSQLSASFPHLSVNCQTEKQTKHIRQANPKQVDYVKEHHISRTEDISVPKKCITHYIGYWQCHSYVEAVRDELLEAFDWKQVSSDAGLLAWVKRMEEGCSVSVHIRRGDYQSAENREIYGKVCTPDYYHRAMQRMRDTLEKKPTFYLFSDDKEWTKKHFNETDCIVINVEESGQDWKDLYLMTRCEHHIIANSSFSWWGAWLGRNPNKTVIAPEWWYYGMETPDLLPSTWILLPIEKKPRKADCMKTRMLLGQMPDGGSYDNSPGMHGKMGKVVSLFELYEETGKETWRERGEALLDEVMDECGDHIPTGYGTGLCGVGFGIECLLQKGYVEGDAHEILSEIANRVAVAVHTVTAMDTDIRNGWLGIALYLHKRLSCRKSVSSPHVQELMESTRCLYQKITERIPCVSSHKELEECNQILGLISRLEICTPNGKGNAVPTVSVVLPVYNTEIHLRKCLDSLLEQNLSGMEVIMVNDGSTDRSSEIMKEYANRYANFIYLEQENRGLSEARNTGLVYAQGKYIAFLDSDDWLEKDALYKLCQKAEQTYADMVIGNTRAVFQDGHSFVYGKGMQKLFMQQQVMNGCDCFVSMMQYGFRIPMVYNYLYRRSYLEMNGFRFMPGLIHEDELWTPQVMLSARRVASVKEIHYNYLQRAGSIMQASDASKRISSLKTIMVRLQQLSASQEREDVRNALRLNVGILQQIMGNLSKNDKMRDDNLMEQTARHFLFFGSYLRDIGLFDGKMGLVIFLFHYARHSGNSLYEDFAMELFEEINRDISAETPIGLGNGLCGIGWGILYLSQNGFIENNTNEILEEIDERIMEYDLTRMKDLSLENGFQGMALYLSERLKDLSSPYDTNYRMVFEQKCWETGWQAPPSPIKVLGKAMLENASSFPAVSAYCWQKELLSLFFV